MRNATPESFARFLECLSPDIEEAGRRYTRLHEKLIGFFNMKGISDSPGAADETIDRAAIKVFAGTIVPDMSSYCLGIARYIVKERLRHVQREGAAFRNFIEHFTDSSAEQVERIYRVLKPCFEQLTAKDQELLATYCQIIRGSARVEHRRQIAETMQTTMLALRMRVTRLRKILTDCVKKNSEGN